MRLNSAQKLVQGFFEGKAGAFKVYKGPHAPQPTPPRSHRPRKFWDAQKFSVYRGSRPPVFGRRV